MRTAAAVLLLALLAAATPSTDVAHRYAAGAWVADRTVVVAIHLGPAEATPREVFVGFSVPRHEEPGDYGYFAAEAFAPVKVEAGAVVLARRPLAEGAPVPMVLVLPARPAKDLDVHEMIDEDAPPGTILFEHPFDGGGAVIDRHVAVAGDTVTLTLKPPEGDFFGEPTMEVACVARRLPLWTRPEAERTDAVAVEWAPTDGATLLTGEAGEKRLRSHFTDPRCPWAERHVKWMADFFVLMYLKPAGLTFHLDTSGVKTAGRVGDVVGGYHALGQESIWPNGFGGTSTGASLPPLIVVPKGTPVREVELR
jgi:hypothetical protein